MSCNPATQARDLALLCGGTARAAASEAPAAPGKFSLAWVQAVDMFPHTDHCETVAVLDRRAQ